MSETKIIKVPAEIGFCFSVRGEDCEYFSSYVDCRKECFFPTCFDEKIIYLKVETDA